jgi:hypothetical protein
MALVPWVHVDLDTTLGPTAEAVVGAPSTSSEPTTAADGMSNRDFMTPTFVLRFIDLRAWILRLASDTVVLR